MSGVGDGLGDDLARTSAVAVDEPAPRDHRDERGFGRDGGIKPVRAPPQVDENLLDCILGVCIRRGKPARKRPDESTESIDALFDRGRVLGRDSLEQ